MGGGGGGVFDARGQVISQNGVIGSQHSSLHRTKYSREKSIFFIYGMQN